MFSDGQRFHAHYTSMNHFVFQAEINIRKLSRIARATFVIKIKIYHAAVSFVLQHFRVSIPTVHSGITKQITDFLLCHHHQNFRCVCDKGSRAGYISSGGIIIRTLKIYAIWKQCCAKLFRTRIIAVCQR